MYNTLINDTFQLNTKFKYKVLAHKGLILYYCKICFVVLAFHFYEIYTIPYSEHDAWRIEMSEKISCFVFIFVLKIQNSFVWLYIGNNIKNRPIPKIIPEDHIE